jgi:sialic acid synthase SpsE
MHYARLGINKAGSFGTGRRHIEASEDAGVEDIVELQNELHVRN